MKWWSFCVETDLMHLEMQLSTLIWPSPYKTKKLPLNTGNFLYVKCVPQKQVPLHSYDLSTRIICAFSQCIYSFYLCPTQQGLTAGQGSCLW